MLSAAGAKHLLLLSLPVTNASALVIPSLRSGQALSPAGAKHLLLVSCLVTNASALVILSPEGAKDLLLLLSPLSRTRARACHAERRRREAPAFASLSFVTNAGALVILSAVRREGPALGMPDAKAGPSLRALTRA